MTSPELIIFVPTRGRPENAIRLESAFSKTKRGDTDVVFLASVDDPEFYRYADISGLLNIWYVNPKIRGFTEPLRQGLSMLAKAPTLDPYAVGFMGDDHYPQSVGWDVAYLENLQDMGTGFVYGNDLGQGQNIPTQIAMTYDIVKTLGYMTPPGIKHLWADTLWLDWGQAIDKIRYLPATIIEHLHPAWGKTAQDPGYDFSGSSTLNNEDFAAYLEYKISQFDVDVAKLRALL